MFITQWGEDVIGTGKSSNKEETSKIYHLGSSYKYFVLKYDNFNVSSLSDLHIVKKPSPRMVIYL